MRKKYSMISLWLLGLTVIGLAVTSCTVDDTDAFAQEPYASDLNSNAIGIFEGEWTVDRQPIGTAILQVTPSNMKITMPEAFITQFVFSKEQDMNFVASSGADSEFSYQADNFVLFYQGYSDNTMFYALVNTIETNDTGYVGYEYNYKADLQGNTFDITAYSNEGGKALYDRNTGLWTVILRIDSYTISSSGFTVSNALSEPLTLIFNAKKKTEE